MISIFIYTENLPYFISERLGKNILESVKFTFL